MKIVIEITKKHLYILTAILIIFAGMIFTVAYETGGGGNPTVFGHSVGELALWPLQIRTNTVAVAENLSLSQLGISQTAEKFLWLISAGGVTVELDSDGDSDNMFQVRDGAKNTRFVVKENGQVGIGTDASVNKLQVIGGIRASKDTGNSNYTMIAHGGSNAYIDSGGVGNFDFRRNEVTKMTLTNQGRLGIGTNTPSDTLDVRGAVRIDQGDNYDVWIQGGSVNTGEERNLAILGRNTDDRLIINYGGEYTGGTLIQGKLIDLNMDDVSAASFNMAGSKGGLVLAAPEGTSCTAVCNWHGLGCWNSARLWDSAWSGGADCGTTDSVRFCICQ